MTHSVEKLTEVYLKIKAKRDKLSAEYKEQDGSLKDQQEQIKRALLAHCSENNVESVRTKSGTFFRGVKQRYWTNDWESMYRFIIENNVPEFFTKQLNQGNVKQFLEENEGVVPPGLNCDSEYVISIRKAK